MSEELDKIRAKVAERTREEEEHIPEPTQEPAPTQGTPDDPRFVMQCLDNNERGDGILFASLQRGKLVCNKSKKDKPWLKWAGHHWQPDHLDEAVRGVEEVALTYAKQSLALSDEIADLRDELNSAESKLAAATKAEDAGAEKSAKADVERLSTQVGNLVNRRKSINRRIDSLRGKTRAEKCLWWSHCINNPLAIVGDEIDLKPWLLACPNGVVNLRTGTLEKGKPDDYLVRAVPLEFPEGPEVEHYLATGEGIENHAPRWMQFFREIHREDPELIKIVGRIFGYAITGLRTEHFIACFIGDGANGKGTMFETLQDILGELAWSIDPEMILEQKNARSSGGPNADIVSLQGRRLVVASETEEGRRVSTASVKRLTGADTLKGRSPHDKYEINFKPTHKLILYTNQPPRGLASDFAMLRRLLYIWYPLRYVDDPETWRKKDPQNQSIYRQKDPELPEKLKEEGPWILAWLVRQCLLWQAEGGLKPPEQLRAAAEAIRREEDHVERFIEDMCEKTGPEDRTRFKTFYTSFKHWYEENVDEKDRWRPSNKKVAEQLRKKGYQVPAAKDTGGTVYVYGLNAPDPMTY